MNEDFTQFLQSSYSNLTANEKKISDYLIENNQNALNYSIKELALNIRISEPTIVRYAKKLGFDGYKALRLNLAKKLSLRDERTINFKEEQDTLYTQIENTLLANLDSIKLTLDGLVLNDIKKAAELIKNCKNILFFGIGTSAVACFDASIKFQRIKKNVFFNSDIHVAAIPLSYYENSDVVIGISHSGNSKETCKILELAKQNGIQTVAITSFINSKITDYADVVLRSISRESNIHKIAITSRTSQFSVIDALFTATLYSDYDSSIKNIQNVSELIQRL